MQTQTRPHPAHVERGAVRTIRRHPLAAFLIWFFTIGQTIAFIPVMGRQFFGVDVATEPFLITATFVGLLLPALAITWITDGPEGLSALRRRILAAEVPASWYGFAVVGVPLVVVAVWASATGAPDHLGSSALASALGSGLLLQLVVVFVTFNLWEEVAWMALQGWVYNRTGSLAVVGLLHAAANATAAGSLLGAGLLDRLYPGDGAGGLVFPVLGALGLVAIVVTRGRLGNRSPQWWRPRL